MTDRITEQCRRVRDKIVERQGGFDGFFDNLEKLDRERIAAQTAQKRTGKKRPTPKQPPKSKRGRR